MTAFFRPVATSTYPALWRPQAAAVSSASMSSGAAACRRTSRRRQSRRRPGVRARGLGNIVWNIGGDQDGLLREAGDPLHREVRQRAGIDDDMIVGARQRIDRDGETVRRQDRHRVHRRAPGPDEMHARMTVARDDLAGTTRCRASDRKGRAHAGRSRSPQGSARSSERSIRTTRRSAASARASATAVLVVPTLRPVPMTARAARHRPHGAGRRLVAVDGVTRRGWRSSVAGRLATAPSDTSVGQASSSGTAKCSCAASAFSHRVPARRGIAALTAWLGSVPERRPRPARPIPHSRLTDRHCRPAARRW